MIDPDDPLDVQVLKQSKIIEALINRLERSHELGDTPYSLFHSAIALQGEVWEKTRDLEQALNTLGKASTELKTAYDAQEQTQKNLSDTLEIMEEGFALFSNNKLQICNNHFKQLLPDVSQHILPGMDFDDYVDMVGASRYLAFTDEEERANWKVMRRERHEKPFSTFVLKLRNDRWFQVSDRRTNFGNIAILQTDITDIVREKRREKDHLIDEHAQFLQAAFDHMMLGIGTFSAEGKLIIHNNRFADYLLLPHVLLKKGTSIDRIIDAIQKYHILDERMRPFDATGWARRISVNAPLRDRIVRTDGVVIDLRVHRLPNGDFIASVMDITAESQATAALKKINENLEQMVRERTAELTNKNRLLMLQYNDQTRAEEALLLAKEAAEKANQSKTRFLAAASHDLLQPINAAKLYISTLRNKLLAEDTANTVLRLERTFSTIETLLHALLDISQLDAAGAKFHVTDFCIGEILESLEGDFARLAQKKGLQLSIVPSSAWIKSDQHYLRRIVQNLVANAVQYTKRGRVLVGCRRRDNMLTIEVWDTGIGISKKDQKSIFEEFTSIKATSDHKGMGLGLSIVERACRQLGHKVRVRSKPGVGSVFSVDLPKVAGKKDALLNDQRYEAEPSTAFDLIIMVVENDADVLFATTQKLESWGASVLAVKSTEDALDQMNDLGMPPDIALVDYHLDGDDNGVETITRLRAAAKTKIPAIMITANRSEALVQLGEKMGFSVLMKPVQLPRLRALIAWKTRTAA